MRVFIQYVLFALFAFSTILLLYCALTGSCLSKETFEYYAHFLEGLVKEHYYSSVLLYLGIYALAVGILFPILAPFTVLGGFLFGIFWGVVFSCVAALFGALASFLCFRYFLSDFVQKRYARQLSWFNERIKEDGGIYLLVLHLLLVPYSVINMFAAVTPVSSWTFSWTTVLGSVPIAVVYTFAGSQLHKLEEAKVFSPKVIGILVLLAVVVLIPVIIKHWSKRSKAISVKM